MHKQRYSLQELASFVDGQIKFIDDKSTHGQPIIDGLGSLKHAQQHELTFFAHTKYKEQLAATKACAVLIRAEDAALLTSASSIPIIVSNPYAAFAKLTALFAFVRYTTSAIHPTAIIHPQAVIGTDVIIGPYVVIEADVNIGDRCHIEANSYIGHGASIGADGVIDTGVHIHHHVCIGERCRIHSGAVIGAEGFGFAPSNGGWQRIVHLGTVQIGDDVRIGANSTIDRGALEDTHIGHQVIIDNQVQIAHNAVIGDATAIAAGTGIAGSATIGKGCIIGGFVAIIGHLSICDRVSVTSGSMITKSITKPGSYSSGGAFSETNEWRKSAVMVRQLPKLQLDKLPNQLKSLQQRIEQLELQLRSPQVTRE